MSKLSVSDVKGKEHFGNVSFSSLENGQTDTGVLGRIVAIVFALLNSGGGCLKLKFAEDMSAGEKDGELRKIEQHLFKFMEKSTFSEALVFSQFQGSLTIDVKSSNSLCTAQTYFYLPTLAQVIVIPPWELSKSISNTFTRDPRQLPKIFNLVLNQNVPFTESDSIQFKHLKDEKSKRISLADRMVYHSTKLKCCMSAFGNKNGGMICFGITNECVIKGERIDKENQADIVNKVTKVVNGMVWRDGNLEKGKHWDIRFEQVKDDNMHEIPCLFVVIVSIVALPGGVFAHEPESYHVVNGEVKRISWNDWKRRFDYGNPSFPQDTIPSIPSPSRWSTKHAQRIYHKVLQKLVKYGNNANDTEFKKFASLALERYADTDIDFIVSVEQITVEYKKGQIAEAERMLANYKERLSKSQTKDPAVFRLRFLHSKSAIARAKGDFQESYDIAREGLQQAESVPAGILRAWFYNHVAIVAKRLSLITKKAQERSALLKAWQDLFIKALQHISRVDEVEQTFSTIIADAQQRIHLFHIISILGDFENGPNFQNVTSRVIKAAHEDILAYKDLKLKGFSPTKYRKTYYSYAKSDLLVCQWWAQQQRQQQPQQHCADGKSDEFLQKALSSAKKGVKLAITFDFSELKNYGKRRLAVIEKLLPEPRSPPRKRPKTA